MLYYLLMRADCYHASLHCLFRLLEPAAAAIDTIGRTSCASCAAASPAFSAVFPSAWGIRIRLVRTST